jgi:hypothetical protein
MRALAITLLALLTAGCTGAIAAPPADAPSPFAVEPTDSPYARVTAGPVSGLIPAGWEARPLETGSRYGFTAAPLGGLPEVGSPTARLTATWVDATRVGVPSDFYYLAASGPALGDLLDHPSCTAHRTSVFADHSPSFLEGGDGSPGDFIARGHGTCVGRDAVTRWSFFVAAPGYGPARALGIPSSGLYVVTAATVDGPQARATLGRMLGAVRFGGARMGDFVRAVGPTI